MNFEFSDEQLMLREEARRFLSESVSYAKLRKELDAGRPYDMTLWKSAAELGWLGVAIPEDYGGTGLGGLELCVLAEEMGRAVAPIPFSSSVFFATEALLLAGNAEQKQHYLPRLADGTAIGTFAIAEGPYIDQPETLTARFADGLLNGVKSPVPDAALADFAIVAAKDKSGTLVLLLVELKNAGVALEPMTSFDPFRPHASLRFADAKAQILAGPNDGARLLTKLLDRAAILTAFEQIGGAEACLDMGKTYAMQRFVFARPIGSFQAIKHKLADMVVKTELARSNAYYGAYALASDAPDLPLAAAAARLSACEAYEFAARENLHIHGGIGYTWEGDCHFHYRRERLLQLALGTSTIWSDRLIATLEERKKSEN